MLVVGGSDSTLWVLFMVTKTRDLTKTKVTVDNSNAPWASTHSAHTQEMWVTGMLTNLRVEIISQHPHISKQHTAHNKHVHIVAVNQASMEL